MTKVKMYCPETKGTFKMMFGFAQPTSPKYIPDSKKKRNKKQRE
tara:strand:+ start:115 stop:246 length:132 start_codon:yes stop_codon:yes gene_type:complete